MHMELRSRSRSKTPFTMEQTDLEGNDETTHITRTRRTIRSSSSSMSSVKTKGSKKIFENVLKTSDYSSEDGDGSGDNFKRSSLIRHMTENDKNQIIEDARAAANGSNEVSALGLYLNAGRYFDKYPKTDWTYSPHSKDRVEIAPGVVAMPNMSRPTIHSTYFNSNKDVTDNTSFTEHNYATSLLKNQLKRRQLFKTESNDNNENYYHIVSESRRLLTTKQTLRQRITVYFWNVLTVLTTVFWWFYRKQHNFLIWTAKKLHRFASSVMLLDTWLLRKHRTDKTIKGILLLCLIPLLLFGGWWLLSGLNNAIYGALFNTTTQAPSVEQIVITPQIINKNTDLNNGEINLSADQLDVIASSVAANLNINDLIERILLRDQKVGKDLNFDVNDLKLDLNQLRTKLDKMELKRNSELHKIISEFRLEQLKSTENLRMELKRCCRYSLLNLENYIRNLMNKQNEEIRSLFMANQQLKVQMNNLNESLVSTNEKQIIDEILRKISIDPISDQRIKEIVKSTLEIYDADKTGLVDYAMESMGGQIVTTRCTETYHSGTAVMSILGIPLWYPSNTPRTVITPSMNPGECWAFQNFPGFLVIKLSNRIKVDAFSLEHISRRLVPNGRIDSAPKQFEVYGLQGENDKDPVLLGDFTYDVNGDSLQFFTAFLNDIFDMIELRIKSNHGNPNYTCLYRFRVHGHLA